MRRSCRILRASALALVLALIPHSAGSGDEQRLDVPAGTWKELPGTSLKEAWASWGQPDQLPQGSLTGAAAIITAWNSGAFDTKRGLFVIPRTGGHADWAGNQVVALDVNALTWRLLRPPSPNYPRLISSNPRAAYTNPYSDGTPASVHTYDAVEYLPSVDRIWSSGGIYWSPGGESSPSKTWWWNPTSIEWEPKVTRPGGYGTSARWVPSLDRLIVRTSQGLYSYDPATDSYKELFQSQLPGSSSTLALDDADRRLYRFVNGKFAAIDLRNPSGKETLGALTGDTSFTRLNGIGAFFDKGKVMVFGGAADASRGALHVVDPATRVAARYDPPDDVHPPAPIRQGTWKRFFEARGYYWVITGWRENVWVFNPGPQGVSPKPSAPRAEAQSEPASRPAPSPPAAASSPSPPPSPSPATPPSAPPPQGARAATEPPASDQDKRRAPAERAAATEPIPLVVHDRTWVPRPQSGVGEGPSASRGKHMRVFHDSKRGRIVLTGGDYPYTRGDGNALQLVWAIDLAKGAKWELLHGWCSPPGGVQPARPDNVTWVYDSKRDQGIIMPAYYFGPAGCPDVSEAKDGYVFDLASNAWQPAPWPKPSSPAYGGDIHNHWGVYDPVSDGVYRFYWRGSLNMQVLDRGANRWGFIPLRGVSGVGAIDASNDQPAIDPKGRSIYVISRKMKALLRYSIDKKDVVEAIPMPAAWTAPSSEFGGGDMETYLAFDSINRVLINPMTHNYGGKLLGLGIYHVDTKKWEWEEAPEGVSGNTLAFDATNNIFMFFGRSATHQFWLYRYRAVP
jgi:hypothetical protein